MEDEDGYFGERVAATYDGTSGVFGPGTVEATAGVLAELAGGGRALELAIGTGRIALPLARRGVEVHGIELSRAMVARLRAKPGGEDIPVAIGDMATATMDGTFSMAYLVFNTIMNLTSQDAQVACFRNAARHLEPGGCFVIECRVPELRRLPPGQNVLPWHVSEQNWVAYSYDPATQAMHGHYVEFTGGQGEYRTMPFRYVWPSELDLMAQLAGMRLRDRWEGWSRQPFTSESSQHVSVWEKPGPLGIRHNGLMDADVVVIGAGALGLSTALHCALAGRSVVVVERHTAGSQASGRAAGLFKSVQADELRTRLARRSITRALSFTDWAGVPLPVARSGSFLIARTPQHREYLGQELAQSRRWGADVREAPRTELSYYQPSGGEYALWCPEDVYIEEPASLIQACLAACRQNGAVVAENEPVIGIPVTAGRAAGVETERRSIAAPVVVDAAGGWVRQVAGLAGARVPVAPVRHQLLITEPTSDVDPADAIARVVDAAVYLRPARGGLMVGGFEPGPLPVDPEQQPASFSTDDVPLDLGVLRKLAGQVAAEAPAADSTPVAEHRGGLFTMSPDGRFVVGPAPDLPGLWVASGCNGSGFSSSLAIGEALAAWITSDTPPPGMTALAPDRFGPLSDEVLVSRGLWQYAHYYDPAGVPS